MEIIIIYIIELIAKIAPEVWGGLLFSSKMTLLYQFALNFCNFLLFSSNHLVYFFC
ncbi:hypothetical protein Hanom_Chr11g01024371 [Helianthus anomalus]